MYMHASVCMAYILWQRDSILLLHSEIPFLGLTCYIESQFKRVAHFVVPKGGIYILQEAPEQRKRYFRGSAELVKMTQLVSGDCT